MLCNWLLYYIMQRMFVKRSLRVQRLCKQDVPKCVLNERKADGAQMSAGERKPEEF